MANNRHLPEGLTALSKLRQISLKHIPAPAFLSAFPDLVDVHLSPSADEAARDLKVLRMPEARLPSFPTCLLQIAKLESLDLANMHSLLTVDVVDLASLPCLTCLNFDFNDDNDSRMNINDGYACEELSSIEESRFLYLNRLLQALGHRQQQLTPDDVTKHNSWMAFTGFHNPWLVANRSNLFEFSFTSSLMSKAVRIDMPVINMHMPPAFNAVT
ncbi:TPA: hypothetical protein ACH3X1_001993 [Trebouxia sp. C0004]